MTTLIARVAAHGEEERPTSANKEAEQLREELRTMRITVRSPEEKLAAKEIDAGPAPVPQIAALTYAQAAKKSGVSSMNEDTRPGPSRKKKRVIQMKAVDGSLSSSREAAERGSKSVVPSFDDTMPMDAPPPVMRPSIGGVRKKLDDDLAKLNLKPEEEATYKVLSRGIDYFLQCREKVKADRGSWVPDVEELIQVLGPLSASAPTTGKARDDPVGEGSAGKNRDLAPVLKEINRRAERKREKRSRKAARRREKLRQEQQLRKEIRKPIVQQGGGNRASPFRKVEETPVKRGEPKGPTQDKRRGGKGGAGRTSGQKQETEFMVEARRRIKPKEVGIPGALKIRTARTGALLIEMPGLNAGPSADRFAEELGKLAAKKGPGYSVQRPVKTAALRLTGLDATVGVEDVTAAVALAGGCPPTDVSGSELQFTQRGTASHGCGAVPTEKEEGGSEEAAARNQEQPPTSEGTRGEEREEARPASSRTREDMIVEAASSRTLDPTTPMEEEPQPQRGKRRRTAMEAVPPAASSVHQEPEKEDEGTESPERTDKVRRVEVVETPLPTTLDGEPEDAPSSALPDSLPTLHSREEGEVEVGTPLVGTSIAPVEEVADTTETPKEEATTTAKDPSEEIGTASPPPEVSLRGTDEDRPEET
ncbi:uncharacterized protein LOC112589370 [Harpegnathos saltator]|uniref:uncharacterized protein LOC112589370 n=1 Tax=Harpegnathos saltator TaxID=610380 RepID=UPI000DBEE7AD|nr:uncharacterized protein LOC112589370 [Harpegnathos saltator]